MKPTKLKVSGSIVCSFALPVVMLTAYLVYKPFSRVLATRTISLVDLSPQQKLNVQNAADRLNGMVVKPHDTFSFNGRIGPRDAKRGYLPAPSYVGTGSPDTIGGGICLLSSALYQTALEAGFDITSRTAHMRAIHSVPPGLDATVWYGGADLKFSNSMNSPVAIVASYSPDRVTVQVMGDALAFNWQPARLVRCEQHHGGQISVTVTAIQYGHSRLVSQDTYSIPTSGAPKR
jgi:vancomycin resistance protein YoaR